MKTVSIIHHKWISSYLPRTKNVDTFRLAGMELQRARIVELKVEESPE
jgi:hypothetical protein